MPTALRLPRSQFGREPLQLGDPVLGRRMGREQIVHAVTRQRIDDEHVRGRRIAFGLLVRDLRARRSRS